VRDPGWRPAYEQLRAVVMAGGPKPDDEIVRRLDRFGLAGLAARRPAWQVVVAQAAEARWTGRDPRQESLQSAYQLAIGGRT
jgi:hypothetical protein